MKICFINRHFGIRRTLFQPAESDNISSSEKQNTLNTLICFNIEHLDSGLRKGNKMTRLMIIADDLTGALDTGVQFAAAGACVKVITNWTEDLFHSDSTADVLVVDTESRHIAPEEAYRIVYNVTAAAVKAGIPHLLKKTDSALRGNVGSELAAMLDASGRPMLPFLPAFPTMDRITKNGYQYIGGHLLEESIFNQDPFEPAKESYVPKIIAQQSDVPVQVVQINGNEDNAVKHSIAVFDAQTKEQLRGIAQRLMREGKLSIMAGCAGLASALPDLLGLTGEPEAAACTTDAILTICGSVNPITARQLEYGEAHGFHRIRLTTAQKLQKDFWSSENGKKELRELVSECLQEKLCILDTNDIPGGENTVEYTRANGISSETIRENIPEALGTIASELIRKGLKSTIVVMGGDTLIGILKKLGVQELEPVAELLPGTVLAKFRLNGNIYQIITKSGGFGKDSLLTDLAQKIITEERKDA